MRSSLKQHRCRESDRTYNFLGEVVTVRTQSYRCISVSDILLEIIFGHNYSCSKILDLIVYKSTNLIHMNFASARRLQDVFTINKNSGVNFIVEGNRYVCCGKVQLVWKGKLILGYIMDEDDTHYHVHIMMNMIIKVKKPHIREVRKPDGALRRIFYEFEDVQDDINDCYTVKKFWPVRFKISKNSMYNLTFILNKIVFDKNEHVIEQKSS